MMTRQVDTKKLLHISTIIKGTISHTTKYHYQRKAQNASFVTREEIYDTLINKFTKSSGWFLTSMREQDKRLGCMHCEGRRRELHGGKEGGRRVSYVHIPLQGRRDFYTPLFHYFYGNWPTNVRDKDKDKDKTKISRRSGVSIVGEDHGKQHSHHIIFSFLISRMTSFFRNISFDIIVLHVIASLHVQCTFSAEYHHTCTFSNLVSR